jgi:antirestriction protein
MQSYVISEDLRELAAELMALDEANERNESEQDRLLHLRGLAEQIGADDLLWYGENIESTLIRADTFESYAQELAEDIVAVPEDNAWPLYCIDWERAARELAHDYSMVSFNGHDWYIRQG